jgi:hypothetical protein
MANSATTSESQNAFRIIEGNDIGGPYRVDENTVLLMHFDGDLTNQSTLSGMEQAIREVLLTKLARTTSWGNA